ncbi:MAG TPA: hypothetical protein PKJ26_02500 [Candidatus Woesebacteria bacterium]|nr:hypothetical protein [Candidatus Woesebacteria bacterium]HNS65347.1 hypothetical protein [Candidatus Woesebacteria bacterium]
MPDSLTTSLRSPKAIIITLGGILIMSIGVIIALVVSSSSVDPRKSASVPGGTVEVSLSPTARTLNPGESTTVTVTLDTKGTPISGIAVRVLYPFSGTVPAMTASNPNPLISQRDSNWSCQVVSTTVDTNVVKIDLGCLYVAQAGFISSTPIPLESFTLTAGSVGVSTPYTLSFEPASTVVTSKATGEDIAAIPTNTSIITVSATTAATPTPTPTPTIGVTATPTPTSIPGLAVCNQTCIATRDCESGLSCLSGRCRTERCANDTTCLCTDYNVASQSGTTELPDSGGVTYTMLLILIGSLLTISGGSYFLYAFNKPYES